MMSKLLVRRKGIHVTISIDVTEHFGAGIG